MVRIVNGEVMEVVNGTVLSRRNSVSAHGTPVTGVMQQGSNSIPSFSLSASSSAGPSSATATPLHQSFHSTSRSSSTPSPSMQHRNLPASYSSPPPLALGTHSAQYTNPYLSHTNFGGGSVTSGEPFDDQHAAAAHHTAIQQAHQQHAAAAAAAAAVASYYPYHALHGFMGAGFILGHATGAAAAHMQHQQQQQQQQHSSAPDPTSSMSTHSLQLHQSDSSFPHSHSHTHAPLPVLGVTGGPNSASSSSCPSPLLTSTSERRRSKPHVQFVPPTHSVMPNGLVLPLLPPMASTGTTATNPNTTTSVVKHRSTSARVSHAFNLFGLPPVFIYEIRVPPHIYLLTATVLYFIGPPALIPLVACFFLFRWHLQTVAANEASAAAAAIHLHEATIGGGPSNLTKPGKHGNTHAAHGGPPMHHKSNAHPSGVPKVHPSPTLSQRKHSNIHSLYDS